MKRGGPLRRNTPLRRTDSLKRGAPLRRGRKSRGVDKDVYAGVVQRDGGCVARTLMPEVTCFGRLDPHHVLRRSQGGQDTPDNLVTLCRAHHDHVHRQVARSLILGLLRQPQPGSPPDAL